MTSGRPEIAIFYIIKLSVGIILTSFLSSRFSFFLISGLPEVISVISLPASYSCSVVVECDPPYSPLMFKRAGVAFKPWGADEYEGLAGVLQSALGNISYTLAVYNDLASLDLVSRVMADYYEKQQVGRPCVTYFFLFVDNVHRQIPGQRLPRQRFQAAARGVYKHARTSHFITKQILC